MFFFVKQVGIRHKKKDSTNFTDNFGGESPWDRLYETQTLTSERRKAFYHDSQVMMIQLFFISSESKALMLGGITANLLERLSNGAQPSWIVKYGRALSNDKNWQSNFPVNNSGLFCNKKA